MSPESTGAPAIRTPDQRLRVFVSSTLDELAGERRASARAIAALGLIPVMFEQGARPHPPQAVYRAYLEQSDIFVGLYWQSYGQVPPGMEVSGLEEEFELSRGLPRLLYAKVPATEREPALEHLMSRIRQEASYRRFATTDELESLLRADVATLLSERFATDRAPHRRSRSLRVGTTSLVGRDPDIEAVTRLIHMPDVRLVTLTGPGGVGKTRLAVAVAERLVDRFDAGIAFVPLETVTDPGLALTAIARRVGAELRGASPLEAVIERLGDGHSLLLLDNLERTSGVAPELDELLARCPRVSILATSRSVLRLRAEREYVVRPLASAAAVELFVDRARAVRHDFALTTDNAASVTEICRRLEGLPLAIELAAARIRLLEPDQLLSRLATSLDLLRTSSVDLPERQRTLRATVEWSVDLLGEAERDLLETAAVFVDGWTVEAAAAVAGLDEERALDLTEALARQSVISLEIGERGPRPRMLDTIHAFLAERLVARPDVEAIRQRHAEYYWSLAEQADRPLRSTRHRDWLERLELEAGNFGAAVHWYLDHDTGRLPHLFRALALFWELHDRFGELRPWIDSTLLHVDSMSVHEQAELLWIALFTANEMGDNAAAQEAGERLAPLIGQIDDPQLLGVGRLALAWILPIRGDYEGAIREALDALDTLRSHDEPYWAGVAGATLGGLEIAIGHDEHARQHLVECRELADRLGYNWLAAWSRSQLAALDVTRGRLDEARTLLDESLRLSLTTHDSRNVSLVLVEFARLALAVHDPDRAARLLAAAEGMRKRMRLRPWPMLRRGQAELQALISEALGPEQFAEAFADGAELSQQNAVAVAQELDRGAPS